jgi:hypothetical protein
LKNGLLPPELQSALHIVRICSNEADHVRLAIERVAHNREAQLSSLPRRCEWLFCESPRGPRLKSAYQWTAATAAALTGIQLPSPASAYIGSGEVVGKWPRALCQEEVRLLTLTAWAASASRARRSRLAADARSRSRPRLQAGSPGSSWRK